MGGKERNLAFPFAVEGTVTQDGKGLVKDHTEPDLGAGAQPCSSAQRLSLLGEFIPGC